jgi:hypothetical protein
MGSSFSCAQTLTETKSELVELKRLEGNKDENWNVGANLHTLISRSFGNRVRCCLSGSGEEITLKVNFIFEVLIT